jgi:hypothetical protein
MRVLSTGANGLLNAVGAVVDLMPITAMLSRSSVQLRWMIWPRLGMPSGPFRVFRENQHKVGSKQQLANDHSMWDLLEEIFVTVDDSSYDEARRRLDFAIEPPLPGWNPVDRDAYLKGIVYGKLGDGLRAMLGSGEPHYYFHVAEPNGFGIRSLTGEAAGVLQPDPGRSSGAWYPWRVALLAASSDPWASLALGFGTGTELPGEDRTRYMITAEFDLFGRRIELAELIELRLFNPAGPHAPTGLGAHLFQLERPTARDEYGVDIINVTWDRPPHPFDTVDDTGRTFVSGYAIARKPMRLYPGEAEPIPSPDELEFINTRRSPEEGGGYAPLAASKAPGNDKLMAVDRIPRTTSGSLPGFQYLIGAQDIFGRWAGFDAGTVIASPAEAPCAPHLRSVQLDSEGRLTVEFTWDWSERELWLKLGDDGLRRAAYRGG